MRSERAEGQQTGKKRAADAAKMCRRFLFLPMWLLILLTLASVAALTAVFLRGWDTMPFAYAVYVGSFYTLVVVGIACVTTLPAYYRRIRKRLYENHYAGRYLTDATYKLHVGLHLSLCINLLYAGINAVSAVWYETCWFAIFAVYYGVLAIMRFLLVRYVGKKQLGENDIGEWKRARACACLLMTVNLMLSGVVLMMVYFDRGFSYRGVLIYAMALYTFYTTTTAVIDVLKYRKYHSPVMSMSKIIRLAASLFSMLFLETAMFAQFGQDMAEADRRIMIMATGAGICVIVVGMSVSLIVRANREIKKSREREWKDDTDRA